MVGVMLKVQTSILSYPIPKCDDLIESDRATARDVATSKNLVTLWCDVCSVLAPLCSQEM